MDEISTELAQNQTITTILEEIRPPVVNHQSTAVWNYRIDQRSSLGENGVVHEESIIQQEGSLVYSQPHNSILNQKVEIIDDSVLVVIGQDELHEDTILISAMNPEQVRVELSKNWKEQELFVNKIVRQIYGGGRRY